MKKQFCKTYEDIISLENLFAAWREFVTGKRKKRDIQEFSHNLSDNIVQLHQEPASFTYRHGSHKAFQVAEPKPRQIHKATVRDRVVHHAVYRQLYPFFDRSFIADSFSCRLQKGAH
jgi:RNA-directed DNA polymerase